MVSIVLDLAFKYKKLAENVIEWFFVLVHPLYIFGILQLRSQNIESLCFIDLHSKR